MEEIPRTHRSNTCSFVSAKPIVNSKRSNDLENKVQLNVLPMLDIGSLPFSTRNINTNITSLPPIVLRYFGVVVNYPFFGMKVDDI